MIPRLAFIKYGGLAAGGTERLLQEVAVELVNRGLGVDFFFCEPRISPGSSWIHPPNDRARRKYLESCGVKLIEFDLDYKDLSTQDHSWVASNFFEIFDERRYEMVWTAKAGPREYPFHLLGIPFVEIVTLDAGFDNSPNRMHSILISNWQRCNWIDKGGDEETSSILPIPVANSVLVEDLRSQLRIPREALVLGFHQRVDNAIVSRVPFEAISQFEHENLFVLVMGGGEKYREIAKELNLSVTFLPHNSDWLQISKFLNTIDIYTHGRADGETFGSVLAEAISYGIPVISHHSAIGANAHVETIANGGFFAYQREEYNSLLGQLIENSGLRARIGAKGKAFAEVAYSTEAFKNNIGHVLSSLGLLKDSSSKARKTNAIQTVPKVILNTRVLVHGLPDSWIKKGIGLWEHIQATREILNLLKLQSPMFMVVSGFESLIMAIEIGRGLPSPKIVILEDDADSHDWIIKLMKINGIIDFVVAENKLQGTNAQEALILSFCEETRDVSFRENSQSLLWDMIDQPETRYSYNLFLPLFNSGKVEVVRRKIEIVCDPDAKLYSSTRFFLINSNYLFASILQFQFIRTRRTKLYKRFIHVKFLIARRVKVKKVRTLSHL